MAIDSAFSCRVGMIELGEDVLYVDERESFFLVPKEGCVGRLRGDAVAGTLVLMEKLSGRKPNGS